MPKAFETVGGIFKVKNQNIESTKLKNVFKTMSNLVSSIVDDFGDLKSSVWLH